MENSNNEVRKAIDHFSEEVIKELKSYVYRLIDPRNGETFYVGKGKGNRVFAHVKCALDGYNGVNYKDQNDNKDADNANPTKMDRIREIHDEGLEVIYIIQRWGMDEETAFAVESALIDCYPGLTNLVKGHDHEHGVYNAETLEKTLNCPIYDEPEDFEYILIKIRQSVIDSQPYEDNEKKRYEAVRSAWKVDLKKVNNTKKYPYVFAVVNGIVRGVYKVDKWEKHPEEEGRFRFEGTPAENEILNRFNNKRIPQNYREKGMASPVLYSRNMENK